MVSINTNVASLLAQNNTRQVNNELEKAMERLSSGLRINSASDDAAGLAISSKMEAQVRGLQAAIKNANDGISVTQVAEGAMEEIGNILQRMRELAVQAANDSNSDTDRSYLQAEVSQLSDEISRISSTTQFNGINVLDGSFANKSFQIGANANQNVNLSIANVGAASLGIGSTNSTTTSSTTTVTTGAGDAIGSLSFDINDVYSMQLKDEDTGLSYKLGAANTAQAASAVSTANQTVTINDHGFRTGDKVTATGNAALAGAGTMFVIKIDDNTMQFATSLSNALNGTTIDPANASAPTITGVGMTLTIADPESRADFADRINIGLKESATNTSIDGFANSGSTDATTLAADTADNELFKFALTVNGVTQNIDIKSRVLATASSTSAVTRFELQTAMREAVQNAFDDSISVAQSSGQFTIQDAQGRSLELSQGEGTGFFFGTDEQNNGKLSTDANVQNNLSVAWNDDGSDLVVYHAAAGGLTISAYDSVGNGVATFDVADSASSSFVEPVSLQEDSTATFSTLQAAGIVGESKIALNFDNTFGYAAVGSTAVEANLKAEYKFKVTDGAGNIYMDFTTTALDIQRLNNSDAAIKSAVEASLSANFATFGDTRIGSDEFVVDYNDGVLTITNTEGRDLAIEDFYSTYGSATVSSLQGLGGTDQLVSQGALTSEIRLTRGYGTGITAGAATLNFEIDQGIGSFTINIATAFDGTTATDTGWEQAAIIETLLQNGFSGAGGLGKGNIRVGYDSATDQFAITDALGRKIELKSATGAAFTSTPGKYLVEEAAVGQSNQNNNVLIDTRVTEAVVTEATQLKLTANQDDMTALVIGLNGVNLGASTHNWATTAFSGSALQTNLNTLVAALNVNYNGSPISYSVDEDTRGITFTHAQGGELAITNHTTSSTNLKLDVTVESGVLLAATDTSGSGDAVIQSYEQVTTADAEGDGVVDGSTSSTTSSSTSTTSTTGINQISISTASGATSAIDSIDAALNTILSERAKLGALENRLDHTVNNLSNVSTNTNAALSRILDADFAKETTALTKSQILSQAATSMLAQANQSKQSILALLQ